MFPFNHTEKWQLFFLFLSIGAVSIAYDIFFHKRDYDKCEAYSSIRKDGVFFFKRNNSPYEVMLFLRVYNTAPFPVTANKCDFNGNGFYVDGVKIGSISKTAEKALELVGEIDKFYVIARNELWLCVVRYCKEKEFSIDIEKLFKTRLKYSESPEKTLQNFKQNLGLFRLL